MSLLCIILLWSFSKTPLSHAAEKNMYLPTIEGYMIGFGSPKILSPLSKNLVNIQKQDALIPNQLITLISSTTGFTLEIPFEFKNGEYITLYSDVNEKSFNAGNIFNKDNLSIGTISTRLLDNQGVIISEIKKPHTLRLNVVATQPSKPLDLQVKITTSNLTTYFLGNEWITRDGISSLNLTIKPYLIESDNFIEAAVKKNDAWDKVVFTQRSDKQWFNGEGMKTQFACHYDFAKKKRAWNLEPFRPNVDYLSTVFASCNPK